jgi:signal transduction histidine kinase
MVDAAMAPLAKNSGVAYSSIVDAGIPLLTADEEYLRIIIKNLAENAIKFTPKNGTVMVHASYDEGESQVEVTVSDSGPGIPEQERSLIFEMFTQGSSSSAQGMSNGKGLGLAIAQELAVLHNGSIDVASNQGKGSVFTLVLPVSQEGFARDYDKDNDR